MPKPPPDIPEAPPAIPNAAPGVSEASSGVPKAATGTRGSPTGAPGVHFGLAVGTPRGPIAGSGAAEPSNGTPRRDPEGRTRLMRMLGGG